MNNTINSIAKVMSEYTDIWSRKPRMILAAIREAYKSKDNLDLFLKDIVDILRDPSSGIFEDKIEEYCSGSLSEPTIREMVQIINSGLPSTYLDGKLYSEFLPRRDDDYDEYNIDSMSVVLSKIIQQTDNLHHGDMMVKAINDDAELDSAIAQLSAINESNLIYPYFDLSYDEPKIWRPYDFSNTIWVLKEYKKMKRFGYLFIARFFSEESLYCIDKDIESISMALRRNYNCNKLAEKAYSDICAEYEKYHTQLDLMMSNDVKLAFTSQKSLWDFCNMEEDMYGSLPDETRSLLATPHNDLQYWIAQLSNIATGQSRNVYAKLKVSHMLNLNTLYAPIVYAYNAMADDDEEE